jgi:cytochrome c biogenesis protein CcdA
MVVLGMLFSFIIFTFLLNVVLAQFPVAANYIRIATYYILLLFGAAFITQNIWLHYSAAVLGAFFFLPEMSAVLVAVILGSIAMHVGGSVASWLQNVGSNVQQQTHTSIGSDNPLGAFVMGLTMGLVWVPCAGPALGFVFTLIRERPGLEAFILLLAYGLGTAIPLLLIGYGGQYAAHSVRSLSRFTGRIKQVAGVLLVLSALALQYHWFTRAETWLVVNTSYGTLGTRIEEQYFGEKIEELREQE